MSLFSKALIISAVALIGVSYAAAPPPRWDSPLILDDFDDIYGDAINRTCLGAVKSYSVSGTFTKGSYGYWYVYSGNTGEVFNGDGGELSSSNIKTAFDEDLQCMHVKFDADPTETGAYAAIAANLFLETDYVDLSKMTSFTVKVKGSGDIRFFFKSKFFQTNKAKYSWGEVGFPVTLTAAWKTLTVLVKDIEAAEFSDAYDDGVDWNDCKDAISAFVIELAGDPTDDNTKKATEFWVDSIVFDGMTYLDVMEPYDSLTSVKVSRANLPQSAFCISNNQISYSNAASGDVNFSIVDLNGTVVSRITGISSVGTHSVALPKLSAGSYIVRMNGRNSSTRQFQILR